MDRLVTIKSARSGLELYLDSEVPFAELLDALRDKFKNSAHFFQGAQMAVTFLNRNLNPYEEQQIINLITEITKIDIVCILDKNPENEFRYRNIVENTINGMYRREGQFYRGTLGKRQVIESDSSIVILGNVELGARVISKGSVVVVGDLRGTVHAGAAGDRNAYVVALTMKPKELKIGDVVARRQIIYQESLSIRGPKIAIVEGNKIYLDPLVE